MDRRHFIRLAAGATGMFLMPGFSLRAFAAEQIEKTAEPIEKLVRSNAEWKKRLTPEQYNVLREEGTEHPFSSPLDHEWRDGIYACAGCGLELFPSKYKYDSDTGWPSFYDVLPGRIETQKDFTLLLPRTEYHCARCGGHHGHVFHDGPKPTGLRYCNNGVALRFIAEKG